MTIPDVLATRYASAEMVAIWSPRAKIIAERRLWLAVLRAQRELGVEVPEKAIADYELLELIMFRVIPKKDVKPLAKTLLKRFGSFGGSNTSLMILNT